tara:strand:+ start:24 stop:707 length:684 start_codon:yes stop_codon:yes gene_type:complete
LKNNIVEIDAYTPDFMADWISALNAMDNPNLDGRANYGTYPTLGGCLAAAKIALQNNNLAIMQMVVAGGDEEVDRLVTRVIHISGSFIEDGGVPLYCADKNNPQKMGSCITYARRYGLLAMIGCVGDDDDDGQAATPKRELPGSKIKPQPVRKIAADIPFDESEATPDYSTWVAEAIAGFEKHNTIVMHEAWVSINTDTLKELAKTPILREEVLIAWKKRKGVLVNE